MKKDSTEKKTERFTLRISLDLLTKLQYKGGRNLSEYICKLIEADYDKITKKK